MVNEFEVSPITEGKAIFLVPSISNKYRPVKHIETKLPVFYNPRMKFNRDISILFLDTFLDIYGNHNNLIVDALAGTGIRSIRYGLELINKNVSLISNDLNPLATFFIERNVVLNGLNGKIDIFNLDANQLLSNLNFEGNFPINIDIDPFGSPVDFYESALRTISKPGLLSITATDTAVLCGVYPNVAFRKYGGISINNEFCHEIGIRLLIYSLSRVAMRLNYYIIPLVSLSTDHYFRIWVKVLSGRKFANNLTNNFGYILYCPKCMNRKIISITESIENICSVCNEKMYVIGPLWIGNIFDNNFIISSLKYLPFYSNRVNKTVELMKLESLSSPLYYNLHRIAKNLNVSIIPINTVIEHLLNHGYIATRTHFNPNSIRTNAPLHIIKSILRDESE